MAVRFRSDRQPPWWPRNEPWPHRRRSRFVRRIAFGAFVMLTLSVTSTAALFWLAATAFGVGAPFSGRAAAVLAASGAVCAGLVVFGLVFMARRVAWPLGAVMEAADRVAAGNYEVRLNEQGSPPLRGLARAFNAMTARLQAHERVRRDLMADIAHELRTPLTVMQGRLEGLLDGVYQRDDGQLEQLLEETHVLSRLVEDLRTLALSESGALKLQRESADLATIARDSARSFESAAAERRVTIAVNGPGAPLAADVDPVRIREVIGNLLSNAVRHSPAGGTVTVTLTPSPAAVSIDVRDEGPGMTAGDLARAFERFHRGPESRGTGLGLAIAKGLVTAHGGTIDAASSPGRGMTVSFKIPIS